MLAGNGEISGVTSGLQWQQPRFLLLCGLSSCAEMGVRVKALAELCSPKNFLTPGFAGALHLPAVPREPGHSDNELCRLPSGSAHEPPKAVVGLWAPPQLPGGEQKINKSKMRVFGPVGRVSWGAAGFGLICPSQQVPNVE